MGYTNLLGQVRVGVAEQLQTATYLLDSYSGAAAAYSLRKLNSTYGGSAIRVRRSVDNVEGNIGFDASGNLDTSSLLSFVNSSDTSTSKLLDQYSGAAVAYSLRKLSATYSGSAIRVRRSSDNTEQNIGFDGSGNLDTTSLLSFVGTGNGFVTTWYDQSGNVRNASQSSAANQPKIVNSGSVILENGRPTVSFTTSHTLSTDTQNLSFYDCAISFVSRNISGSGAVGIFGYGTNGQQNRNRYLGTYINTLTFFYWGSDNQSNISGMGDTTSSLYSLNFQSNSVNFYKNNSTQTNAVFTLSNTTTSSFAINEIYTRGERANMNFSEGIFYTTGRSTNMNGIRSNQNSYYSVYTPTSNGFVTTWYDQSGNGKNVTQTTSANQPQIVSNGSILLRNGKPAIDFTSGQTLRAESRVIGVSSTSIFNVFSVKSLTARAVPWDIGLNTPYTYYAFDVNTWQTAGQRFGFYTSAHALDTNLSTNLSQNILSIISNNSQGSTISTNTNYHINNKLGTLPANNAIYANFTSASRITFGSFNGPYAVGFDGTLQEFIAYQTNKLTDRTSITNDMNGYYSIWDGTIVQSGLVMNLDPSFKSSYLGTGSTWTDISYNGNNGTLTNGPSFATASGGQITFDGVNDFVKVPLNLSSYSQITVEIWYKINSGGSNLAAWGGMLWEHSSDWNTNTGGLGLAVNSGGCTPDLSLMHTNHNGGSGAMNYQYNSGTTWSCHVNIFSRVSDPTGRLAYVNGLLAPFTLTNTCSGVAFSSSTATSASYSPFRNDFLYLSSRNGTGAFINGNIGLIRVYNRKLSASEIQQNFNVTKSRFGL